MEMNEIEVIEMLREKFLGMHIDEIEDVCGEYATVGFIKRLIESVEEALNNAEVITAYRTPVIRDRDNGGDSDGGVEIVEPEELEDYGISIEDVEEVRVIKIEVDDYNAYLVLKEIIEREELDYCGMSSWNTLYILL